MERFGSLAEELRSIIHRGDDQLGDDDHSMGCCGSLRDVLEALEEETGLDQELLAEAMKCKPDCKKKYMDKNGTFKGGKGDAFNNCVEMFEECCTGARDPRKLCAYIGRRAGKI